MMGEERIKKVKRKKKNETVKVNITLALIISIIIITYKTLEWTIIDKISIFLHIIVFPILGLIFFSIFIINIISLIKTIRKGIIAFIPIIIQVTTVLIIVFVPFTDIWLKIYFMKYRTEREIIVKEIYNGELFPNIKHNSKIISLGKEYPYVSMGGNEIIINEYDGYKNILFYTFRGILDNYSGFLYVPKGGNPFGGVDTTEMSETDVIKLKESWYYISNH